MGNEQSAPKGLEIDEKAVEITDFWLHHSAVIHGNPPKNFSVFISEPSLHSFASFGKPSPLEKASKNLMLHRHPNILRYMSTWSKGSKFFLATEQVKPLVQVIGTQTTLQICIGLHSILKALNFLHEKALASHNNVCSSSIHVTTEGTWKLSGLEYLCKFSDLDSTYIRKIKNYRYDKAISPNEDVLLSSENPDFSCIDKYAYAVLAEEVLKLKGSDDVPGLSEFKKICKEKLKDTSLLTLSENLFFTHDFMQIYGFLNDLPLQNETEKEEFFLGLVPKLKQFPEKIVAEQLGKLLLSRMVLLDQTAQAKLLHYLLKPKETDSEEDPGLFSISTFQIYIVPKLLEMFCVRDAPIRMLLLSHLNLFIKTFQFDDLKLQVLPELLVGIKDTDDFLVSTTLHALADLVPLLGAATVIGGNRAKLFTDGRPNKLKRIPKKHVTFSTPEVINEYTLPLSADVPELYLSERPSPDGGEDKAEPDVVSNEEDNWSDWEVQENELGTKEMVSCADKISEYSMIHLSEEKQIPNIKHEKEILNDEKTTKDNLVRNYSKKPVMTDISELDIKNSKAKIIVESEIDFFSDMEPIIEKNPVLQIEELNLIDGNSNFANNLLPHSVDSINGEEGWNDNLGDWDIESDK